MNLNNLKYRFYLNKTDVNNVREIVSSTGFFQSHEIYIAVELIEEALSKPDKCDYKFIFLEVDGKVAGYACYGEIPCTKGSYDLYWIAVKSDFQGLGIGKKIILKLEEEIIKKNGRIIFIETSGKAQYESTRGFYLSCGYDEVAKLKDFYESGDDKIIYSKKIR